MKQTQLFSRRDFIMTVSHLAVACAALPQIPASTTVTKDEFVIVNGWVLHRSDLA